MMVGGTVQYTLLLRFSPFETKEWRKNCNVTRTLRLDCREESISEFGAAEGMGQTHQQGTLQSSSGKKSADRRITVAATGIASCVHGARKELLFRMKRNTLQKGLAMTMERTAMAL